MTLRFVQDGKTTKIEFTHPGKDMRVIEFVFTDNMVSTKEEFVCQWEQATIETKLSPSFVQQYFEKNIKQALLIYVQSKDVSSEKKGYFSNDVQTFEKINEIHNWLSQVTGCSKGLNYVMLFNFLSQLQTKCRELDLSQASTYVKSFLWASASGLAVLVDELLESLRVVVNDLAVAISSQYQTVSTIKDNHRNWNLVAAKPGQQHFVFDWVDFSGSAIKVANINVSLLIDDKPSDVLLTLANQDPWFGKMANFENEVRKKINSLNNGFGQLSTQDYLLLHGLNQFLLKFDELSAPTYNGAVSRKKNTRTLTYSDNIANYKSTLKLLVTNMKAQWDFCGQLLPQYCSDFAADLSRDVQQLISQKGERPVVTAEI
jgi:hypothetical protein